MPRDQEIREAMKQTQEIIQLGRSGIIGNDDIKVLQTLIQTAEEYLKLRERISVEKMISIIEPILTKWRDKGVFRFTGNCANAVSQTIVKSLLDEEIIKKKPKEIKC